MQLLLVGYYGYNNLGDELLAKAAANIVRAIPATSLILTPQLRTPWRLLRSLQSSDGVVFGGGSLFQDVTGKGLTVLYYVSITLIALCLRKKIFFIGQGMGPIRRPLNRVLLRYVLQRATFISLRNRESLAFVQALGVSKAVLANDLLLAEVFPKIKKQPVKKLKIVLSFRSGLAVQQLLVLCAQLQKYELVIVPLQKNIDEQLIHPLRKYARVVAYHPEKIMQEIATADLAVGMRLHFLIIAAAYTVPFIGLVYDPKVESMCKHWHMPYVPLSALATLPGLIARELPKRSHYRTKLGILLEHERHIAKVHVLKIQEAIGHAYS